MRLLVDLQALQSPTTRGRGIARYARNLLHALASARHDWHIEAFQNGAYESLPAGAWPGRVRVDTFTPPLAMTPASRPLNERFLGDWIAARQVDLFLELSVFDEHALVPVWTGQRPPLAAIAYDLIPVLFHSHYLSDPGTIEWYADRMRQFAEADRVLAISEATRQDVLRLLGWPPSRVVTILGAAEHETPEPVDARDAEARLQAFGIDRPFVVCVGGADRRKNMEGTLAAFAALPPHLRASHLLVIVCALSDAQAADLQQAADRLGIGSLVRITRFVSDEDLHLLYERSRASLFLSFYEGLGLPVLESLRAGTPVVTSDRSSIPEFADPSSPLVNPADPVAAARALETLLTRPAADDGHDARRAHAARFTWARTAEGAATALEDVLVAARPSAAAGPRRHTFDRLRVAWFSPLPPTKSGIADYSAELLARMPPELEISLVIAPQATLDAEVARGRRVLRPHDLEHADDRFDLCVYHVGNSVHHLYMLDAMRRHSGLLVLHDLFVGGLALRADEVGAWPGGLAAALDAEGEPLLAGGVRRGEADHGAIAGRVRLSTGLVARSEGVIVHSAWSWTRVRAGTTVPVFRVPHGIPEGEPGGAEGWRREAGIAPGTFLIVTLGETTAAKRIDRLLLAVHQLPERIREHTEVRIVGEAPPALASELLDQARQLGIGDRVAFTGRVPLASLGRWGAAATACVQLRHPYRGETSGALLRALAAGAACIVSDEGSFAETPPSAALRVPVGTGEVEALCRTLTQLHDEPRLVASLRAGAREWVRTEGSMAAAAARYVAAMQLTAERRRQRDGAWMDAATTALARAGAERDVPREVLTRWVELRARARRS